MGKEVLSESEDEPRRELNLVLRQADIAKEEGNSTFRSGDYAEAVEVYSSCLARVLTARGIVERQLQQQRQETLDCSSSNGTFLKRAMSPSAEQGESPSVHPAMGALTAPRVTEAGAAGKSQATATTGEGETTGPMTGLNDKDLKAHVNLLHSQVLCNRALCYLRLKSFDLAEADCTAVLALDPLNVKALYRRACAREEQGRLRESLSDLSSLLQRGRGACEAADRRQQEQMLRRVREKLLHEEKQHQEMQQPQALLDAAFAADSISSTERAAHVGKAAALLHSNPDVRRQFLRDGFLLRVSDYLTSAPSPEQHQQRQDECGGQHQRGQRNSAAGSDVAVLTPAVEAACWELLLRCVVDEGLEEQLQRHEGERRRVSAAAGRSTAGEKHTGKQQENLQQRGCLRLLRQRWSSEQLLLRLRRLLQAGITTRRSWKSQQQPRPQVTVRSSSSGSENNTAVAAAVASSCGSATSASPGKGAGASPAAAGGGGAAASAGGAPEAKSLQNERNDGGMPIDVDEETAAVEFRVQACCSLLQLLGQLEQLNASSFEDDAAFCTACLLGMQQTTSIDVQLAAVDAAAAAATCRRKLGVQQAPALALRQNIEKWLEELLQLLAELQHYRASAKQPQQQQHEATTNGDETVKGEDEKKPNDVGHLQNPTEILKRERMEAQVECLLVTLVGLLVDKVRALPPLFAAAAATGQQGSSSDSCMVGGGKTKQKKSAAGAATSSAADVGRLLEQLLTPYLPLSASMLLDWGESSSSSGTEGDEGDSSANVPAAADAVDASNIAKEIFARSGGKTLGIGGSSSSLARGEDVEEAVEHQIVGLKVLRLLLPAAREEVSQFLVGNVCGAMRFAVAAAADDERVRLPHTPHALWLQQQAAAAELLVPAMDFPELRHRLLQAGGIEAITSVLSDCCISLRSNGSPSCLSLPVSVVSSNTRVSTAASVETSMRWVICGKLAAVLARLAVHHEEVRIQVFDLVDFTDVLGQLLHRWERQQEQQLEELGTAAAVSRRSSCGLLRGREDAAARAATAGIAGFAGEKGEGEVRRGIRAAGMQQREDAYLDFAEVFCFVSLHGSFKERLAASDEGLLQRLLRLASAAFGGATGDNNNVGTCYSGNTDGNSCSSSSNRNLVMFLLLQGLCNLMRSRDDPQRRPSNKRQGGLMGEGGGGPQLDEEQQQQLQEFFSQLPAEAQPPVNGKVDAGGTETAGVLQGRLVACGVVRVVAGVVLSNLRASAAAAAQEHQLESEVGERRRSKSSGSRAAGGQVQYLSPNALVAAADAVAALSAKPNYRGIVVREGGFRMLLGVIAFLEKCDASLYEAELRDARQALARLCISVNPTLLSYQEAHEAITYVMPLLRDAHELLQYEAALALTNLTSSGAEAQAHAWHAGAWDALEDLLFSENPLLRAAGLEGWCNLADSVVVQQAIGDRCERTWQAEKRDAVAGGGEPVPPRRNEGAENEGNSGGGQVAETGSQSASVRGPSSHIEVQCLKILLAYCLEDENVRARHAAVAALAMLVTDPRTAAAATRCSNFSNICVCLDRAQLNTQAADAVDSSRYIGDSLILRVVATMNHMWTSLKEVESKGCCCNFTAITKQLHTAITRNKHKLKGLSLDLANQLMLQE